MTHRNGFDRTVRCYALADGRCTHMDCPKRHRPECCAWRLIGHVTEGAALPSDGDDRPLNDA